MLLSEFIRFSVDALRELYPDGEAGAIVSKLCEERLGVKSYTHIVEPSTEVPSAMQSLLENDIRRLLKSEPLQYVLGYEWFCDRKFLVNGNVLIPRPETEEMVQKVLDFLQSGNMDGSRRVLDLCTGSGCIAWSVAAGCPNAEVTAVDVSEAALSVAVSQNIECHHHPLFVNADILGDIPERIEGEYDVIVSNPPYVKSSEKEEMRLNVLEYEPGIALFVPDEDPLVFYRSIASWCRRLLKNDGKGIVEINETLSEETVKLFESYGFSNVKAENDFRGRARFVDFRLK